MPPSSSPIRVLVVDVVRAERDRLSALLQSAGGFEVVGTAGNGREAVTATALLRPQVVAMPIDLPGISGFEVAHEIMRRCPTPIILLCNALDTPERHTLAATAAGALGVARKPGHTSATPQSRDVAALCGLLRTMAGVPLVTRYGARPEAMGSQTGAPLLRPAPGVAALLTIAASTGGPTAVQTVLAGLKASFPLPILLVQHITIGFTASFVEWLNSSVEQTVVIAQQGERLLPGHVYVAPDQCHLLVRGRGFASVELGSRLDRYCPSADTVFASVARIYGANAMGVILTGMGDDGARGMEALARAGGWTLAQDEASSVVYGMPGAAVAANAVTHVAPLPLIAGMIAGHVYADTGTARTLSGTDSKR